MPSPAGTVHLAVLLPEVVEALTVEHTVEPMVNVGVVPVTELDPKLVPDRVSSTPPAVDGADGDEVKDVMAGAENEKEAVLVDVKVDGVAVTVATNEVPTDGGTLHVICV